MLRIDYASSWNDDRAGRRDSWRIFCTDFRDEHITLEHCTLFYCMMRLRRVVLCSSTSKYSQFMLRRTRENNTTTTTMRARPTTVGGVVLSVEWKKRHEHTLRHCCAHGGGGTHEHEHERGVRVTGNGRIGSEHWTGSGPTMLRDSPMRQRRTKSTLLSTKLFGKLMPLSRAGDEPAQAHVQES